MTGLMTGLMTGSRIGSWTEAAPSVGLAWAPLAAGAAAGAVLLGWAVPRRVPRAASGTGVRWVVLMVTAGVAGVSFVARPRWWFVAVIAAGLAAGVRWLLVRRRALAAAAAHRARLVEACVCIAAELQVGSTPSDALTHAARDWPLLATAARTARSGGPVVEALRAAAEVPGAADLRMVAAAWQLSHRTGHGLADTLHRVAAQLRAAERTRHVVAGELASARATARLVAVLPLAALAIGSGTGASPVGFLLGEDLGLLCLAGGLACGLAGLAWIEAIAASVEEGR